jgi:peptidoglycan hydrolase-like protein with peptidoglycan-binding domain
VDVEPYPTHPWSRSKRGNRAVISGVVRGYEDNGYRVGFYSYAGGWLNVVGNWRLPRHPAWYPVGPERYGYTTAARRCAMPSFSGGPVMIGQWVDGHRDRNVSCSRLTGRAESPHPLTRHLGVLLRKGSTGAPVRALQKALGVAADGVFGRRTRAALRSYQSSRGLPPTGVTGDDTWRALGAGTVRPERPSRLAEFFTPY